MGRRQSFFSSGGGAAGTTWASMLAATGFTGSDYYSVAAGEAGSATGFGVACLFTVLSQSVGSTFRILGSKFGSGGWTLDTGLTLSNLSFSCTNGAAGTVTSPVYTITASDVGKVMMAVGVHDGSNVRLYVNRAEVGSGSAIVGYTASASAMSVGSRGGLFPASSVAIHGFCTWTGTRTLKQIQCLFDDVKAARDMVGALGTHAYSLKRAGGSAPPATWSDLTGTDDLARVGSALTYQAVSPTFAW